MSDSSVSGPLRKNFARVISLVWLSRAGLGWLVALPLIAVVNASGVPNLLLGDRALFEPGGLWLAELLRVGAPELVATLRSCWPFFALALAVSVLSKGVLLEQTLDPFASLRAVLRGASSKLTRLLGLSVVELLVKLVLLGALLSLLGALERLLPTANEAWRDSPTALCAALALLGLGVLGVLADVQRVLFFRRPQLRATALQETWSLAARHARLLGSGYLLRVGLGALSLAASARLVELIDVSRAGALRVLSVLLVHLGELLLLTLLEAGWLARVSACAAQPPATRL